MITAILPIAIALVGVLLYLISQNPKVVEIGRLMFFAGVMALAFALSGYKFSL